MSEPDKPVPMFPATQTVHWPGRDYPMCEKHAEQARGIAQAMGFILTTTPCVAANCGNCVNEWLSHLQE